MESRDPIDDQAGQVQAGARALADALRAGASQESVVRVAERLGALVAREGGTLADAIRLVLDAHAAAHVGPNAHTISAAAAVFWRAGSVPDVAGTTGPLSTHVARLAALHRINQAATATLDLATMLGTVVAVVRDTTFADSCSIFLFEPESATLTLRATVGLNEEAVGQVRLPLGTGITGRAAADRRLLAIPDARVHPAYVDYPLIGDRPYTSQVSVPLALRSPDRLVGVLNILTIERREFEPDELTFLETAAGEIAIAIENARLYSETDAQLRRRISQLGGLQQMSRAVASTLDLREVLRLITRQAVELSQASAAEIYRLPRRGSAGLELLARFPEGDVPELDAVHDEVVRLVQEAVDSGVALWRGLRGGHVLWNVNAVPMLTGRRAVGAVCVFHRSRASEPPDIQGILHAFSDAAAVAIENAELYEEAVRGMTRASTLLQEMHHRVRNNLQTVAALLSMQARRGADAGWTGPLLEAVGRIRSIAVVHDMLSGSDLKETTLDAIARYLVDEVATSTLPPDSPIRLVVEPSDLRVSSRQATVLALLINEFLSNAVRHGVGPLGAGEVVVSAEQVGADAVVSVRDSGRGLLPAFDIAESAGLGLQIARTLVEVDLRGSLEIGPAERGGTEVRVRFPVATTSAIT
ncbi:MAG TPA: GAF domain-containing protein [Thermomicrobiaceae bacterium]|nr:GAF domain-containing protein [Thermomicrobiaceae bacterium]